MEMDLDELTYSDQGSEIRAHLHDFPEHSEPYVFNVLDDIPEDFGSVLIPALVAASATLSISPDDDTVSELRTQSPPPHPKASPGHKPATLSALPIEIRTTIWRLARPPPRIVRVRRAKRGYPAALISDAKIPNLLHINKESRKLALGWYQLCFADPPFILSTGWNIPNCRPHVYFDLSYDIFYAGCEKCYRMVCDKCVAVTITRDIEKVQKVLFHGLDNYLRIQFKILVRLFPNAREIMILMEKEKLEPEVQFSQLKETDHSGRPGFLSQYDLAYLDIDKTNREKYVADRVVMVKVQKSE